MNTEFEIKALVGLSESEAKERLNKDGYNELPSAKSKGIFAIAFEVVREPMFLLLIAGGAIYLLLGDMQEAAMLLGFVFVVMGITFYQERKTERALEALRHLASPRALVIRDGMEKRIPGREVVRGDMVIVSEGDRIPADAVLISCSHLSVDESLLTGESMPVRKTQLHENIASMRPGGDDFPFVYSGTLVAHGSGVARVLSTGSHTELGKIGKILEILTPEKTPLQRATDRMVRNMAILGLLLCGMVVVIYGFTRYDWLGGILAGITLAMSLLPEEIPMILTVFLALGAWRISRSRVLTRRVPAVETLGSATVLCVDKTGTLTLNKMSVEKIFANGNFFAPAHGEHVPDDFHELIEFGVLASQTSPFDPMEKALRDIGKAALFDTEHLHHDWKLAQEYPLSKNLLAMSRVWRSPDSVHYIIAAKGAPEAIADICHLSEREIQELSGHINLMASEGLRVIGVAKAEFKESSLPEGQHDFSFEFLGLIGLADPVRPGVAGAIEECYSAGMRVVMITGDYPATARNIASQIGLKNPSDVITGSELEKMNDAELCERVKAVNIFARVVPEQKLRIVNAFKSCGEVVAMTGDGVNDAPALKAAHIGIAMGGRGTDVARESAALVLIDDDFSSIVRAVRMGRRVFDNLKKAMVYTLAVHIPIAGMSLLPVAFNWPLVLLPVHIVFLELIIDPACSIVFEAETEEADIMARPPRNVKEPIFDKRMIALGLFQGISVLFIVLSVFLISLYRGQGEFDARTISFTTLIIANLCLILTNRAWSRPTFRSLFSPNPAFWWVIGGALFFLGMALYLPSLRGLFRFSILHFNDLAISFSAGIISIFWFAAFKMIRKSFP